MLKATLRYTRARGDRVKGDGADAFLDQQVDGGGEQAVAYQERLFGAAMGFTHGPGRYHPDGLFSIRGRLPWIAHRHERPGKKSGEDRWPRIWQG